jgi:transposase
MNSKEKRGDVIETFKSEKLAAQIVRVLDMSRRTVYDAIKRYKEQGAGQQRPRKGRSATACQPQQDRKSNSRRS